MQMPRGGGGRMLAPAFFPGAHPDLRACGGATRVIVFPAGFGRAKSRPYGLE